MARRDVKLLGSLVDYVKDVKPYHTKLREFASELLFKDHCNVNVADNQFWNIYLQNMWGRDDLGGHVLSRIAEGIESDRTFRIPPAVWPRFSLTDHSGQTPSGDDPPIPRVDSDGDGIPDSDDPYMGSPNTSHFPGKDWVPVKAIIVDVDMNITDFQSTIADGYVDDDYWEVGYTRDILLPRDGVTYTYTYDLTIYVNAAFEGPYGLGNSWKSYLDGVDMTASTIRDDTTGSFDTAEFDDTEYDTRTRTFKMTDLRGSFTITDYDLTIFPELLSKTPEYVIKYGHAKISPKIEIYYQDTGRYAVPFHQGSRVYVEGQPALFGAAYVVESSRDFIQFLSGRHPKPHEMISVNLMKTDRLFIAKVPPFEYTPAERAYDMNLFDMSAFDSRSNPDWEPWTDSGFDGAVFEDMPYDMGTPEVVCDYFVIRVDDSYPNRCAPVAFYNSTDIDGKGILDILQIYDTATHGDTYLVAATGMWTFTVQKVYPTRGPVQYASFKSVFDNGEISFIIDRSWTPYYMVPDYNTYDDHDEVYKIYPFKKVDETDYMVNLDLIMERGVRNDPTPIRHRPVEFTSIGKVQKVLDLTGEDYYAFILNEIPNRGTYYELRIEQNGGLNPRVHASIEDILNIAVFEASTEEVYYEIYNSKDAQDAEQPEPDPVVYPNPSPEPVSSPLLSVGVVIADMGYDSEVLPASPEFTWQVHPMVVQSAPRGDSIGDSWAGLRPEWCYDLKSWFIIQEAEGNDAENTRVEVTNLRVYYLSESTRAWNQLDVRMIPSIDRMVYPFVVDDEDVHTSVDIRAEERGVSIKPNYPYFYRGNGNYVTMPMHPKDIRAIYIAMDFRLSVEDSNYPIDTEKASYVVQVGGDYYPGNDQGPWGEDPPGIGHGRFLKATPEWKTATLLVPNTQYECTYAELQFNAPPGTIALEAQPTTGMAVKPKYGAAFKRSSQD